MLPKLHTLRMIHRDFHTTCRVVAFLTVLVIGYSAPGVCVADGPGSKIDELVAEYEKDNRGQVGLKIVRLDSQEPTVIAEHEPDTPRAPASNQKVLTSAFALERLGSDFEFSTSVWYDGKNVIVRGGFDPTFADPELAEDSDESMYAELDRWAREVGKKVGGTIEGDVLALVGGSMTYRHPDWPTAQHRRWFCAPVAALSINNNCLDVAFKTVDGKVVPVVTPATRYMRVVNTARLGRSHAWSLRLASNDAVATIRGTITGATPFAYSVAVDDPPLLFARTFADRLARLNIRAKGKIGLCSVSDIDWDKAEQIAVTRTPISKALQRANKDSLNMAAESLMLRSGNGEWPVTAKLMEKTLVKGFGLDPQELTVRDGSGLSRDNRVTPSAMVKVLSKMLGRKGGKLLLESLSVAGKDGTLRKRMNWICRNRVRAKTGYISKVSCLSGYVTDEKGRPVYAFSILVNDIKPGKAWKAKRLQDDICRELVRSLSDE